MTAQRSQRISVEWVKLELLRTAYATRGGLLAAIDPRVVIFWYVLFAIAPWLTHNLTVLFAMFFLAACSVALARVGPLVLGLFVFGLITEGGYLLGVAWFFDGDLGTVVALSELTLKLGVISMASMAAFVSLDPEKLSDALLSLRMPAMLSFGVSYGYRMLPILLEEFHGVLDGHRMRGAPLAKRGLFGWRVPVRLAKRIVIAFYPMFLNTAKRTRTTVEALEAKGFTYALEHPEGRRLRLAYLRVRPRDVAFLGVTVALIAGCYWLGELYPIRRTI